MPTPRWAGDGGFGESTGGLERPLLAPTVRDTSALKTELHGGQLHAVGEPRELPVPSERDPRTSPACGRREGCEDEGGREAATREKHHGVCRSDVLRGSRRVRCAPRVVDEGGGVAVACVLGARRQLLLGNLREEGIRESPRGRNRQRVNVDEHPFVLDRASPPRRAAREERVLLGMVAREERVALVGPVARRWKRRRGCVAAERGGAMKRRGGLAARAGRRGELEVGFQGA